MNFCVKCHKWILKIEFKSKNGFCYSCQNKIIIQKRQKFIDEYGVCKNC